ncbi:CLUMA_CG011184, isoform A [Clunio marinus]|uniref:CLUMA_CG011184, isoform A n=1 Tax=Clunio marinus TaxID=568069 RepID=A0A1J1IC56_9DIPT|nr:CLUMA_CG011184, isoform A [Clunio marinus]
MNKCVLILLVIVSICASTHQRTTRHDNIYESIERKLKLNFPEDSLMPKCMVDDFKTKDVAVKFNESEVNSWEKSEIAEKLEPFYDGAEIQCSVGLFLQTPLGIFILIAVLLVIILICCCIINKVTLISFFVICSIAYIQGNIITNAIDDGIYGAIHQILKNQYPENPEKAQCMVDDFRRNHVADKFYTPDLLFNNDKLQREIQPYVDKASIQCNVILFFQSPLGICVLVALFLLAISESQLNLAPLPIMYQYLNIFGIKFTLSWQAFRMTSVVKTIKEAPRLWNFLNGIVNVYKPSGISVEFAKKTLISNICRDLNNMKGRPQRNRISIEGPHNSSKFIVKSEPNIADHVLVVGERYQMVDFKSVASLPLGKFTSGVLSKNFIPSDDVINFHVYLLSVLGINRGIGLSHKLRENKPIRVYHITGKLGIATESHFNDSPVTIRASFDHVTLNKTNSFLASLQASHQKKMFDICGVDIQSQAAYELATGGPIRPALSKVPLIYSMKCIEFKKPYFTIEIHACNEHEAYLGILINEIGIHMKSVAHCTQIRCIRQSHFTLEDSLVKRHWNVESIVSNITRNRQIIRDHPDMLHQLNPILNEDPDLTEKSMIKESLPEN